LFKRRTINRLWRAFVRTIQADLILNKLAFVFESHRHQGLRTFFQSVWIGRRRFGDVASCGKRFPVFYFDASMIGDRVAGDVWIIIRCEYKSL